MMTLQPTLAAHNFSGYLYPGPDSFLAQFFVHNSANVTKANATLAPLFEFAASEASQNRTVQLQVMPGTLTDYFQIFQEDPSTVTEAGVGIDAVLGSRLAPITAFKEDQVDPLVDWLLNIKGGASILHLGELSLMAVISTNFAISCGR